MTTMSCGEVIEMLTQLSPVPVLFRSTKGEGGLGTYFSGPNAPYIVISNSLREHREIIAVLVHEIGHAICDEKECKCMNQTDKTLAETHAYKFELSWLLKHKRTEELNIAMGTIDHALHQSGYCGDAAKHIMRLKLWQRCLDYLRKEFGMQNINNCSAEGWSELGRERICKTDEATLNITAPKQASRKPNPGWEGWDWRQHFADIFKRKYARLSIYREINKKCVSWL